MLRKFRGLIITLLPAILFLAFWQVSVGENAREKFLFASPSQIVSVAWDELTKLQIYQHIGVTLAEAGLGLLFGMIAGTVVGLLLWGNGKVDCIAQPYMIVLGAIPVFSLAPVMIMWFGIGLWSKVIMAGFAVFFVALQQANEGAKTAARDYLTYAQSIRAPHLRIIQKIIVPGALDWVFAGLKLNVGFALTGAYIAEFVSSENGLGHYILTASSLYDMPRVFFGLALISIIALLLTSLAGAIHKKLRPTA